MKSRGLENLPPTVVSILQLWGEHISIARKRRRLSIEDMARRLQISDKTYRNVEKGDPTAAVGFYAGAMNILGLEEQLKMLADPAADKVGLWKEQQELPERVRRRQRPDLDF